MVKKKAWHCGRCGTPCTIYKKGKGHRVLLCPNCGVIANNPIPLAMIAASLAPSVIQKVSEIGLGKAAEKKEKGEVQHIVTDSKDRPNRSERVINKELYGV